MVELNGIKLDNRFLIASGALEYGRGWPWERPLIKLGLVDPGIFGAVVTKTLTLEPRTGNYIDPFCFEKMSLFSHFCHFFCHFSKCHFFKCHFFKCHFSRCHFSSQIKVLRKIPGGWLNNLGWWNVGIEYWIKEIYPQLKDVTIIPSIGGFVIEDYLELIRKLNPLKLNPLKIAAIELNISCPNLENPLAKRSSEELVKLFGLCRAASAYPLIVKLGIDSDYIRIAEIAQYCGLNAVSVINAVPALEGGQSGRGIKYIAQKVVAELKEKVDLPIIGGGGIYSWGDCQEFFKAGADAISFGSVHFLQPWKPTLLLRLHRKEMSDK